jgi:hypothetical protein
MFGNFNTNENISFIIVDLTPAEMGLGLVPPMEQYHHPLTPIIVMFIM